MSNFSSHKIDLDINTPVILNMQDGTQVMLKLDNANLISVLSINCNMTIVPNQSASNLFNIVKINVKNS